MWHMPPLPAVSGGSLLESNASPGRRSRGAASFPRGKGIKNAVWPSTNVHPQPSETCGSRLLPGMDGNGGRVVRPIF